MATIPNGMTRDQVTIAFAQLDPANTYRFTSPTDYEWRGPGAQPSDAAIQNAWNTYNTAQAQSANDRTSARTAVITAAQSAVGIRFDALTAAQVRALFAILLWQAGGLNGDGTVKPLAQWAPQ